MGDAGINAIDRFFERVDGAIDSANQLVGKASALHPSPSKPTANVRPGQLATSTAIATRRYRIQEVTDAQSGQVLWIVTDGSSRAECNTRELAEKLVTMLEAAP